MFYYFTKHTRYYALEYKMDLFDHVVVKHYGRIGTRFGQSRTLAFEDAESALDYLERERSRRTKRGYLECDGVTL